MRVSVEVQFGTQRCSNEDGLRAKDISHIFYREIGAGQGN
jgi:hypothetical protein